MSPLISFEGGDGAGKTTQAALLVERLQATGVNALLVREPGGTPLGERLRPLVKGEAPISPLAELLLLETARAELVTAVIRPALDSGATVVSDRYSDSTLAYQGHGRGLDMAMIRDLNRIATGGLEPAVTILLDLEPSVAMGRIGGAGGGRLDPDNQRRFEAQPMEFHERVAEGYRALAAEEPARWFVVDASREPGQIAERVWSIVSSIINI